MTGEKPFRTVRFVTKKELLTAKASNHFTVEQNAMQVIDQITNDDELLVLRVRINSPPVVEAAAKADESGLIEIVSP